jgi:hypothetical protein
MKDHIKEMAIPIECLCCVCFGGLLEGSVCSQCKQFICTDCRLKMIIIDNDFCPVCKSNPF